MKYLNAVVLAGAVLGLVGCASAPREVVVEPVGPGPMAGSPGKGDGAVVIYSARVPAYVDMNMDEWRYNNDYGKNAFLYEPAHTDYTIYAQDGKVVRHVSNARDLSDDTPTVVSLAPGTYQVEAQAIDCDSSRVDVLVTVVIKPGQTTLAHLEGGWQPAGPAEGTRLARLPCGRPIGWRASEGGFASNHQGS